MNSNGLKVACVLDCVLFLLLLTQSLYVFSFSPTEKTDRDCVIRYVRAARGVYDMFVVVVVMVWLDVVIGRKEGVCGHGDCD